MEKNSIKRTSGVTPYFIGRSSRRRPANTKEIESSIPEEDK